MIEIKNILLRKLLQNGVIPDDSDENRITETIIIEETDYVTVTDYFSKTTSMPMLNVLTTSALSELQIKSKELFNETANKLKSM